MYQFPREFAFFCTRAEGKDSKWLCLGARRRREGKKWWQLSQLTICSRTVLWNICSRMSDSSSISSISPVRGRCTIQTAARQHRGQFTKHGASYTSSSVALFASRTGNVLSSKQRQRLRNWHWHDDQTLAKCCWSFSTHVNNERRAILMRELAWG